MASKSSVFLSYIAKDQEFADELFTYLSPFERTGFQVWHSQDIPYDSLEGELRKKIGETGVAILLVSADYLASPYIQLVELPLLLGRAQEGSLTVLPIVVRPAAWVQTRLAYLQVLPRDGRTLSELTRSQRDRLLSGLGELILGTLHVREEPSLEAQADEPLVFDDGRARRDLFFISHAKEDGDFAENLKLRMSEAGLTGWIDVDVLEGGADWRKEIDEAIRVCRAVILILSPDSKASEYVTYEWAFGLGTGLRIVPLLLRATPIHPRLEVFQYLDFTNRRARPWARLIDLLRGL